MSDECYVRLSGCGNAPRVYHTDSDCRQIGDNYRTVNTDHVKRRDLRECRVCAGRVEQPEERFRSLRARIAAGEVDV